MPEHFVTLAEGESMAEGESKTVIRNASKGRAVPCL
jgi:hypothetical protein